MALRVQLGKTKKRSFSTKRQNIEDTDIIDVQEQQQQPSVNRIVTLAAVNVGIMPLADTSGNTSTNASNNSSNNTSTAPPPPPDASQVAGAWSIKDFDEYLKAYSTDPAAAKKKYGDEFVAALDPNSSYMAELYMYKLREENPNASTDEINAAFDQHLSDILKPKDIQNATGFNGFKQAHDNMNGGSGDGQSEVPAMNEEQYAMLMVEYVNEFGDSVYIQVPDTIYKEIEELQAQLENDELSDEEKEAILKKIEQLKKDASKNLEQIYANGENEAMRDRENYEHENLAAWDPRLQRADAFFMKSNGADGDAREAAVIVPFSTITAATAFRDMVFVQNRHYATLAQNAMINERGIDISFSGGIDDERIGSIYKIPDTETAETTDTGNVVDWQTYHPGAIPVAFNTKQYYSDPAFYGTSALMSYYALTKLCGGLDGVEKNATTVRAKENFMYDVRDQRRFYGLSVGQQAAAESANPADAAKAAQFRTQDPLSVSIPSVSNIIKWSNADKWGRTPYTYQDFVYSKWFGLIPNNRLITLRRYHAPVLDNLQFDGMVIPHALEKSQGKYKETAAFAPRCTIVTYFGEDTGNKLADLLKFSSGIAWTDAESKIWDVTGEEGDDPQGKIDQMFEQGGGFGSAQAGGLIGSLMNTANTAVGKILSFGKFTGMLTGSINTGMSQGAFDNISAGNKDPYSEGAYENRIIGPINRINKVKRRAPEITFDQSFSIRTTYTAKSIGGINPKAAMLDIFANCLEMVSADALFWGGGHRFEIKPKLYPYHDHGPRDNFMKKLYDGKIFGQGGAIDSVLSGIKSFLHDGDGDIWSNIANKFSQFWGNAIGAIGSVLSSITGSLFGESSGGNALTNFIDGLSNNDKAKAQGKQMMNNLGKNLNQMWKNKVMENTAVPNIKTMNSLLVGEPVGEWHLTIGNPLNPIAVIGNLICEKVDFEWVDELGPDDFPVEFTAIYTLQHGMMRDKASIQSMFNRGMGKIYELPDYIRSSSDFETHVDHYTDNRQSFREPRYVNGADFTNDAIKLMYGSNVQRFQGYKVDPGHALKTSGSPNTSLVTKFFPITDSNQADIVGNNLRQGLNSNLPIIRALKVTRKYTS